LRLIAGGAESAGAAAFLVLENSPVMLGKIAGKIMGSVIF
jgi:hypothetical protein